MSKATRVWRVAHDHLQCIDQTSFHVLYYYMGKYIQNQPNQAPFNAKEIICVLTGSKLYAHTEPLFINWHMMNVFKMHAYFVGIFVFKCVNNVLPDHWNCTLTHNQIARLSLNLL